ncbi:MAG TPA: MarR family winged helix-turn-helix transcriptional regulator [Novosphingobium sp.]|nr:MarR family winged helix-turn-helix transcriptional regulator [Novosphingobium sp.]
MENIGYLLGDSSRLLRRAFDDGVRSVGVTGPQARLLLYMARVEGENQGHYADRLEVEPITLCRMVDRMEDAGLVERRRDPADRRAWRMHLTIRSRAMIAELRICVDEMIEQMMTGINAQDRETFARILTAVSTNLAAHRDNRALVNG